MTIVSNWIYILTSYSLVRKSVMCELESQWKRKMVKKKKKEKKIFKEKKQ